MSGGGGGLRRGLASAATNALSGDVSSVPVLAGPKTTLAPTTTNGSAQGARRVTSIGKAWVAGEALALVIDEAEDESRPWHLRAAIWAAAAVLEANGRWLSLARRYVMTHEPGDCLYVPPAWLLDFDETDRAAARSWELKRGRLVNPDTGQVFDHLWLEVGDVVVSVSNLRNGYPVYAIRRDAYYACGISSDGDQSISWIGTT